MANCLFYSGFARVLNFFVNRVRVRSAEQGKGKRFVLRQKREQNVQILTYHRVNDERDPFFPATPIRMFTRQLEFLSSHFAMWSLEHAVEGLTKKDLPENVVVLTFDDGYADNYAYAFPILQAYQAPATVFLATDVIGTERTLWHDRVFVAFRETRAPRLDLGETAKSVHPYPLTTREEKVIALTCVLGFLRTLGDEQRDYWIDRLVALLAVDQPQRQPRLMLTWEEVMTMSAAGISFGSHTCSHPILANLSAARMREEICESQKKIEHYLRKPVTTFAYPNGKSSDFTDTTKAILREAGFTCAVTTVFGNNEIGQDLFALQRGGAWEEHLATFAVKMSWYKLGM